MRPAARSGQPAFGITERRAAGAAARIASRMRKSWEGPSEQLAPTTSAPAACSSRAAVAGESPFSVQSSRVKVRLAKIGIEVSPRAVRSARSSSARSRWVSKSRASTPAEHNASTCSAISPSARCGARRPYGARPRAERPQAPEDRRLAPAGLDGLPRQAGGGQVEGVHLIRQAVGGQPGAAGPERVGLDQLSAGLQVGRVNPGDGVGMGEVERLETRLPRQAEGRVQQGAHGAIGEDRG